MSQLSKIESSLRKTRIKSVLASVVCGQNGALIYRGEWDASGGVLPTDSNGILKGYLYRINPGGDVPYLGGTVSLEDGTMIMALVDSPGQNMANYTYW